MAIVKKLLQTSLICALVLQINEAQILYVGGSLGAEFWPSPGTEFLGTATSHIEFFIDNDAPFSINVDPSYSYREGNTFTIPFYFKIIFGNRFKVCPLVGAFLRTGGSSNHGFMVGLSFEKQVNEKMVLFLATNYLREYQEADAISPGGISYNYDIEYNVLWFNLGFRYCLFKRKRP